VELPVLVRAPTGAELSMDNMDWIGYGEYSYIHEKRDKCAATR
jgi:hypothetical protein